MHGGRVDNLGVASPFQGILVSGEVRWPLF